MPADTRPRILLIDTQRYWRELAYSALRDQGYRVCDLDTYGSFPAPECFQGEKPDLVVLGCSTMGPAERNLVSNIRQQREPFVVFCGALSGELMRSLFYQGAADVTEKSYKVDYIVQTVKDVISKNVAVGSR